MNSQRIISLNKKTTEQVHIFNACDLDRQTLECIAGCSKLFLRRVRSLCLALWKGRSMSVTVNSTVDNRSTWI